jgi:uracil phosphoribosyltransferase
LLSVIAARDGVRAIQDRYPAAEIYVCEIDDELNSQKFIVPGLGDAGDRTFNTPGD